MARLYIPQVGNKIKLIANWNCKVFNERRNATVFEGLNIDTTHNTNSNIDLTFPKGTVLKVDRLYVRAPASSFDSITFSIQSCPIKSLVKARFWVKLMDANNIQFEEVIFSMDTFEKLSALYRFVALKNDYKNSENLSKEDSLKIGKEIYDHYIAKNNNALTVSFDMTAENYFKTLTLQKKTYPYLAGEDFQKHKDNSLAIVKSLVDKIHITCSLLPVLDGYIYVSHVNDTAIAVDHALFTYNDSNNKFWNEGYLTSNFSRVCHFVKDDKGFIMKTLRSWLDNLEQYSFTYRGETVVIKNEKELKKLFKTMKSVETK
jgi:hypothetical protein